MAHTPEVSVIISTHNRANYLRDLLDSLLAQQCPTTTFEAILVDNNSSDHTRAVIEEFSARSDGRIRYLFEPRPGVSFGRNAGIEASSAPIVAFADDDETLVPGWVESIGCALREHRDVDYLTGKVLPQFEAARPAWMTALNTSACTIPDRGDQPIFGKPGCFFPGWGTGNFAIRRAMLERAGLFATDFPRGQDLELIIRVWRAGGRGMYVPGMIVTHKIPAARTTKAHHRRWHSREGQIRARVRYKELFDRDGRLVMPRRKSVGGIPLFLVRDVVRAGWRWLSAFARGQEAETFFHECQFRQAFNYLITRLDSTAPRGVPITSGTHAWTPHS